MLKSNDSNGKYIDLQSIVSIDSIVPAILIQRDLNLASLVITWREWVSIFEIASEDMEIIFCI